MPSLTSASRRPFALAGVAACVVIALLGPHPDRYVRSSEALHDLLHVPGFALVALLLLVGFPSNPSSVRVRIRHMVLLFALSMLVGLLVEVLQTFGGDTISEWDLARDAAGTTVTLLAAASFWADVSVPSRWLLRGAALVAAVVFAGPTVRALADESRARAQFPVLADFSSAAEFERFTWSAQAKARRVCERGSDDECSAHVLLSPGRYPGFTLRYFPRDWRGYRYLVVSCANVPAGPGRGTSAEGASDPFPVTVRIDDVRHIERYSDRFNATYQLAPGPNEIRVPLADVGAAPRGRKLDLARVRTVVVFAYQLKSSREIVVREVRLER